MRTSDRHFLLKRFQRGEIARAEDDGGIETFLRDFKLHWTNAENGHETIEANGASRGKRRS